MGTISPSLREFEMDCVLFRSNHAFRLIKPTTQKGRPPNPVGTCSVAEWSIFRCIWQQRAPTDQSFEKLSSALLAEARRLEKDRQKDSTALLTAQVTPWPATDRGRRGRGRGGFDRGRTRGRGGRFRDNGPCLFCGKARDHNFKDCPATYERRQRSQSDLSGANESDSQYLDSACTDNMVYDRRLLRNIREVGRTVRINVAKKDATPTETNLKGDLHLPGGDLIVEALWVPGFRKNLISVYQLTAQTGGTVTFTSSGGQHRQGGSSRNSRERSLQAHAASGASACR